MRYEILNDNTVENVISADETFMLSQYPEGNYRIAPDSGAIRLVETSYKITKLAFLNRFTDEEAITIDLASIGSTVQAASMRRYMSKVNAANFIDLSREDTRAGVLALESAGVLANGRAAEILDTPIAPEERP